MSLHSQGSIETELKLANAAYRAGDLGLATSRVDKLLKEHPNRADVQLAKGIIEIAKGNQVDGANAILLSLQLEPTNPEALSWAAFTSLNLRNFPRAEEFARRFVEVDSQNPRAHYLLANALRALDRIDEALKAIDRSLELSPDDTDSLVTKARLLRQGSLPGLAVEVYRKALAIRPTPPAAVDLARILLNESHPQEALDVLNQVAPLLRIEMRPHALIAQACTALRHFDAAEAHWRLAETYTNDSVGVIQSRATAEIAVGRFEIAEGLLRNLIEKRAGIDASFCILTTARKMTPDELPLIQQMEAVSQSGSLTGISLANLDYALGKSFDDLRDFEKAMWHYDRANAVCLESYPRRKIFDRMAVRRLTDFQIAFFTNDRIQELADFGLASTLPLFVVGMMRSGTTLTESILGAHSKVKPGGEQSFWQERSIELFFEGVNGLEYDQDLASQFAGEYLKLLDPKVDQIRHVVDKNPSNFDLASMLHCLYPNAKFVHLKRHPVDNLLSLWMTPMSGNVGYASDKENLLFAYREYLRLWTHLQTVIPNDRFATFAYEDLTSKPDETIGAMLNFLGLEPESACFSPETSQRTVLTPSVHQVRQPIHSRSQARWKNYEPWLGAFAEMLD